MKTNIIRALLIIIFAVFIWFIVLDAKKHPGPKCYNYKTVLNVSPHHATRVFVTYISKCGDTITSTVHCSGKVEAENITFDVRDYLDGKLKYGDIK